MKRKSTYAWAKYGFVVKEKDETMILDEKKKMMIKLAPTVTNQRMKTKLITKATISIILVVKRSNYNMTLV